MGFEGVLGIFWVGFLFLRLVCRRPYIRDFEYASTSAGLQETFRTRDSPLGKRMVRWSHHYSEGFRLDLRRIVF